MIYCPPMEILLTIGAIAACILLFSFAIFIHEFGHFLAARLLGFKVERFSIGFGPALWKRTIGGVEYRISAIPFGGYVALPQLDPEGTKGIQGTAGEGSEESAKESSGETPREESSAGLMDEMPAWKKIVVAFAGPFGNIVLAVALAFLLAAVPGARFGTLASKIGFVIPEGPAEKGGMEAGDEVVSVNGHKVSSWIGMQTELQLSGGKACAFEVLRGGTNAVLSITPDRDENSGAYFILALSTTNSAKTAAWMPDRNPMRQLQWDAEQIVRIIKALGTPREAGAAAKAVGGPVMIAEGLYHQVRRNGWDALGFLRFLNVNLAILNLMPIPVLDGGLILFALFELLFRRKLNKKFTDIITQCFMYLFIALMLILVWRDVSRSVKMHRAAAKAEAEEATNAPSATPMEITNAPSATSSKQPAK